MFTPGSIDGQTMGLIIFVTVIIVVGAVCLAWNYFVDGITKEKK